LKISNIIELPNDWRRFDLNVGGFTIRGCRWHVPRRRIVFPSRYTRRRLRRYVIRVHGRLVMRLRALLESGQAETPRDRTPCILRIRFMGVSDERLQWIIFDFTVRGFTILGCRWQRDTGSIQLPVSFNLYSQGRSFRYTKKPVVCAFGAHINRLRKALDSNWVRVNEEALPKILEEEVLA
jgi:hypothetical protein